MYQENFSHEYYFKMDWMKKNVEMRFLKLEVATTG